MKYWKATSYSYKIELIEVVSETTKYVTHLVDEIPIRQARESAFHIYCKSREEAVRWKQALLEDRVKEFKKSLDSAQSKLREFEKLECLGQGQSCKKYGVKMPVAGVVHLTVEAESESEAIDKALEMEICNSPVLWEPLAATAKELETDVKEQS